MAKRRKKHRKGGRKRKYVFTAARRRALKKAQRARKRKHGGKRKRRHGSKRKRRHSRKHSSKRRHAGGRRRKRRHGRKHSRRRHSGGGGVRHGAAYDRAYAEAVRRGRSPAMAAKIASRVARMKSGSVRRHFEREAVQAKSAAQLSNLFAGFGAAGRAHHAMG